LDQGLVSEFRWTVALEAALFFSVLSWLLTERGWPADGPYEFALAVLIGASAATLLCHVLPAFCAESLRLFSTTRIGRLARWPIGAWFSFGAAVTLIQLCRLMASMGVLQRDAEFLYGPKPRMWKIIAWAIAGFWVLASTALAWRANRWRRFAIALSLLAGFGLAVSSIPANWSGLWIRNRQMISENGLNEPWLVIKGMLMAAAPAVVLALRIGQMRLSPRRIWLSGLYGVWIPLAASVTFISFERMAGARLYWKPSVPIEFFCAFVWIGEVQSTWAAVLWPLSLTMLGSCVLHAVWIRDLTGAWPWSWQKTLAVGTLAVTACLTVSPFQWAIYRPYWLWSILGGSLALVFIRLATHRA